MPSYILKRKKYAGYLSHNNDLTLDINRARVFQCFNEAEKMKRKINNPRDIIILNLKILLEGASKERLN